MGTDLNIGHATAYAYAKSKGYTGTEEQFATELAQFAQNAQKVAEDRAAVEELVDEFLNTTAPAVIQDVTDEGTSQVERVANAGTAQVTRVGEAGNTQIDAVASAGTTQIGLVTAEGTTQVTRVQDKGDEVIDSIPADYTALTEEVSDLNQHFDDYTRIASLEFTKGAIIANGTINPNTNETYTTYGVRYPLSFNIKTGAFAHIFLYSNDTYIGKIAANGSINKTAGDWKNFTGEVYISDIALENNANIIKVNLTPQDGTTLTPDNVNTWGNSHLVAYGHYENNISLEELGERVTAAESNIDQINKDLSYVENCFPNSYVQFVDLMAKTANTLWNTNAGGELIKQGLSGYTAIEPIALTAGTYTCNSVYALKTYVKFSDDTISTFKAAFPPEHNENNYGRTFTLSSTATIYITIQDSVNTAPMIVTGTLVPTQFKLPGRYYTSVDENLTVDGVALKEIKQSVSFDISKYKYAYIHNNVLIGNSNKNAKYTEADMGSNCQKIMCRFKLRSVNGTNTGCVTLITMPSLFTDDREPVLNIGHGSVHVTFTATNVQIGIYASSVLDIFQTINYTTLSGDEETEYVVGMEFLGSNQLKVYLPDDTTQTVTDERIDQYKGQYVIWEHYTQNFNPSSYPEVTEQMPQAIMTGFYCRCDSNIELRDDFKRENGAINVAPTGHTYRTFAIRDTNPTIFDDV